MFSELRDRTRIGLERRRCVKEVHHKQLPLSCVGDRERATCPWFKNTHSHTHVPKYSTTFSLLTVVCRLLFYFSFFLWLCRGHVITNKLVSFFFFVFFWLCFVVVSLILFAIFIFIGFYFSYTSNTLIYFHYQSSLIDQCFSFMLFFFLFVFSRLDFLF